MNWALHKKNLKKNNSIEMGYPGSGMSPQINNGDTIVITTMNVGLFKEGDIVFCKISKNHYVQPIIKVSINGNRLRYHIGDNKNNIIGVIGISSIFGKVTKKD